MPLTLTPILDRLNPSRRRKKPAPDPTRSQQDPTPPLKPAFQLPPRPPEPIRLKDPSKEPKGVIADATNAVTEVTRRKYVARVLEVLDIAGKAGAGLFAAALAYGAMFALIPLMLLIAGVLGWLIEDPVQRQQVLEQLVGYFPPLQDFFSTSLNGMVAARGALSIVGLVGLVWGASAFYGSLDEVMRRIFTGGGVRDQIDRRIRGLITIVGVIVLLIGSIVASSVWAILSQYVGDVGGLGYIVPILTCVVFVVGSLLVYLLVPTAPPSFRAAAPAALLAGIGIGLLTSLFGLLAPWLVGGLKGLGVVATAFAVLIWLNFSFQILLYGAAWARLRRDVEKDEASVVAI